MAEKNVASLSGLVTKHEAALAAAWVRDKVKAGSLRSGQIKEEELTDQSRRFLSEFAKALKSGQVDNVTGPGWGAVRDLLVGISRSRAVHGFTPSETATFIFSAKGPLFTLLRDEIKGAQQLADLTWTVTKLLDALGLYTVEVYSQSREGLIKRQTQELLELSTPVVELWGKILVLPLIGTLD
jgi:rsbT co-antagonist protein RsbR